MIVDSRGCIRLFVGPPSRIRKIQQNQPYLVIYIHYKRKNRTILSGKVYRLRHHLKFTNVKRSDIKFTQLVFTISVTDS